MILCNQRSTNMIEDKSTNNKVTTEHTASTFYDSSGFFLCRFGFYCCFFCWLIQQQSFRQWWRMVANDIKLMLWLTYLHKLDIEIEIVAAVTMWSIWTDISNPILIRFHTSHDTLLGPQLFWSFLVYLAFGLWMNIKVNLLVAYMIQLTDQKIKEKQKTRDKFVAGIWNCCD